MTGSYSGPSEHREAFFLAVVASLLVIGCEQGRAPADGAGARKPILAAIPPQAESSAAAETSTTVVKGQTYKEVVELPGASVHGYETAELKAKLSGYVKTIGKVGDLEIDVGSVVSKASTLAILDIPEMADEINEKKSMVAQVRSAVVQASAAISEAEAEVLQKKAELEQVRAKKAERVALLKLNRTKFERLSSLAKDGTIGDENLDEARFGVAAAEASLASTDADIEAAQTNIKAADAGVARRRADKVSAEAQVQVAQAGVSRLETLNQYATITAPFAGVITKRLVDHGTFVPSAEKNSTAMPVFEITRTDRVRIMVGVPNNKVGSIQVGQAVLFHSIGGLRGRSFAATITRSAGALDSKTRSMQIQVDFTNPAKDVASGEEVWLKPGLFGTLTVTRREWTDAKPLPVVPVTAVGTDQAGRNYVVVLKNGKPERRTVEIAFNDAISVGVARGLSVGEEVMVKDLAEYQ